MSRFTDHHLVDLYDRLVADYKGYKALGYSHEYIADALRKKVENTLDPKGYVLQDQNSNLVYTMSFDEKMQFKVAAQAIVDACGTITEPLPSAPSSMPTGTERPRAQYNNSPHYCCHCSRCASYPRDSGWIYIGGYNPTPGPFMQTPVRSSRTSGSAGQSQADLAYLAIAVAAILGAFLSAYYLYHEMANSLARFYYNEGWLQAALSYFSIAASAVVSGILSVMFATAPLLELTMAAGFASPAIATVAVLAALTVIGAGLGCLAFNGIQDYLIKSRSGDALDPSDPARFALTKSDFDSWPVNVQDNIHPVKVKCAIVALRAELGDAPVSTIMGLFSSKEQMLKKKNCIDLVRKLRAGELATITVGNMQFDLRRRPPLKQGIIKNFSLGRQSPSDHPDFDGVEATAFPYNGPEDGSIPVATAEATAPSVKLM